jgi:hypothetical protein
MSDNVIKSTDVTSATEEKNVVKKAPVKKAAAKIKVEKKEEGVETGKTVIIFDSGFSYSSGDIQFTREDCIQEVSEDVANFLLTLDNFRLPNTVELEDYLNSKED